MSVVELAQPLPQYSPPWWLKRLLQRLDQRVPHYDMLDRYYNSQAGIPVGTNKAVKDAYLRLVRLAKMNFAELIVDAVRERQQPVGFRTGASSDRNGDALAWDIWQGNSLDADCKLIHTPMLSMGCAYAIVGPVDPELGVPLITPEDPRQVIVELAPGRRRVAQAALKVFRDDAAGLDRCYLYLPGTCYKLSRERRSALPEDELGLYSPSSSLMGLGGWQLDEEQALPASVGVPVVPYMNNPNNRFVTRGEYEVHLSVLDRINYTILQRLEVTTLQAFRQRAVKGVPSHDEHGVEIDYDDIFSMDPAALWVLPDTADLWESGVVDLGPIRSSIRDDVQDLAAVTRTPLYYLSPEATNGSAEGASLSRESLVFKVVDRNADTGESHEQVMCKAFAYMGDTERAARKGMEIIWATPERHSLSERGDAAVKAQASGMPWASIMEHIWEMSPQQIARMESQRATDALLAAMANPIAPEPAGSSPEGLEAGAATNPAELEAGTVGSR